MYMKCRYFITGYIKYSTAYQNVCFILVCSFYQLAFQKDQLGVAHQAGLLRFQ